jgi:hypothetical protein
VRMCLTHFSEFIVSENGKGPMILVTPSLISCKGTACISLGFSDNQYLLFSVLLTQMKPCLVQEIN